MEELDKDIEAGSQETDWFGSLFDRFQASAIGEFVDDIGDFVDVTKSRGIEEALQATKDKLLGAQAPEINKDEWTFHADGKFKTRSISAGITEFQDDTSFGKFIDPQAFSFGGGVTRDHSYRLSNEDGLRDLAFAGRPGEMTKRTKGSPNRKWLDFGETDDWYSNTFNEENDPKSLKWMSPKADGKGLQLSSGDEMPEGGLTKIKKIFDLKEDSPENLVFQGNNTYNLVIVKDGNVKTIMNINALGYYQSGHDDKGRMKASILKALDAFDGDEIYYLDAGMNKDWQIGRDREGQYNYSETTTIGATHTGY